MNSFQGNRNISPKAAQLLQEIQSKITDSGFASRGQDRSREPFLDVSNSSFQNLERSNTLSKESHVSDSFERKFSKDEYESDTRGHRIIALLGSCAIFFFITYATYYFYNDLVIKTISELDNKANEVKAAPLKNSALVQQLNELTQRRQDIEANYTTLTNQFTDPAGAYSLYSKFLDSLQSSKIELVSQQATITQSKVSPLMYQSLPDEEKSFKALVALMKKDGSGHVQIQGGAGAATGNAPNLPGSKDLVLSGDVKNGLNYYHLEILLSGSYLGYLSARQSLIKEVPNAVVHRELIQNNPNSPNDLAIKIYMSIPFIDSM
jgi:hypothetical protein